MGYSGLENAYCPKNLLLLLEAIVRRGLHINPLFITKQSRCWSSDSGFVEDRELKDVWVVSFIEGKVVLQMLADHTHRIFDYPETYYVRGVSLCEMMNYFFPRFK